MKIIIWFAVLLFVLFSRFSAADTDHKIVGDWLGTLKLPGASLRLVLHIEKNADGLTGSIDSLDQGALGIPGNEVTIHSQALSITFPSIGASYTATLNNGKLEGTFSQRGLDFPLTMAPADETQIALERPQEPKPPFPYAAEQVSFLNAGADIELAGTLTLPRQPPKATAVLLSGSGPQNRNEELAGHKPFLVIADHLTRNGYAVLRFDDRGTGESGGNFNTSSLHDFAGDAEAALDFIRRDPRLNKTPVGLIGHSEGAAVAGIVAARSDKTDFVVMLAGPGVDGATLYRHQIEAILRAENYNPAKLNSKLVKLDSIVKIIVQHDISKDISAQLLPAVTDYMRVDMPELPDKAIVDAVAVYNQPWFRAFLKLRPARDFANVDVPVLALAGEYDLQVSAEENVAGIKSSIDGKKTGAASRVTTKILPRLNHLFQTGITGHPAEYGAIRETFSPAALDAIVGWLNNNINVK